MKRYLIRVHVSEVRPVEVLAASEEDAEELAERAAKTGLTIKDEPAGTSATPLATGLVRAIDFTEPARRLR